MKRVMILFFLGIVFFAGISNALETKMYGNFSLISTWKSPVRFDYDSIGEYLDTITWEYLPIYGGDSIGTLVLNDWMPAGEVGVKFMMGQFEACMEFGVCRNAWDGRLSGSETTRYLYRKYGFYITANKWYTEWLINDYLSLLLGNDYTPANFFSNNNRILGPQIGYANIGCLFTGSRPMFQLGISAKDNIVEAKLAVVKVDTTTIPLRGAEDASYINEVKIPKFEGSVQLNIDKSELFGIEAKVAGGYQNYTTFRYPDLTNDAIRDSLHADIISYLFGGEISLRIWRFTLTPSMFHGQNMGTYGAKIGVPEAWWRTNDFQYVKMYYPKHAEDTTAKYDYKLFNSKVTEISFVLNIKIAEFLSLEGGYQDIIGNHEYEEFDKRWLDSQNYAWYGQLMFTLFEFLNLTGEVGNTKYGKYKGFGKFFYTAFRLGVDF